MLSFTAKPRIIHIREGHRVSLPAQITLAATLAPRWLFGSGAERSRLVIAGATGVIMRFDANTGRWYFHAGTQPEPVHATYHETGGVLLTVEGNVVKCVFVAQTLDDISEVADALLYGIPMMFSARLPSPCIVESLVGQAPDGAFGYEFFQLCFRVPIVRQDEINAQAAAALKDLTLLGRAEHTRIHAALIYFHRAERLLDAGHTPWEFMAESVLNLAKALESLFPGGKTRDTVRQGLAGYGFSAEDIETWFVPVLALRSNLDVAHVKLALLTKEHIEVLTQFVESAATQFRSLLLCVLEDALAGKSRVPMYKQEVVEGAALDTLNQLTERLRAANEQSRSSHD